jgi:hypothetical protein
MIDVAEAPASAVAVEDEYLDETFDRTQLSVRRREEWELVTKDGDVYRLTGTEVTVGRAGPKPASLGTVEIVDSTKTISKAHATFTFVNGAWFVQDLSSTNGTSLIDAAGREIEVPPGAPVEVTGVLLLGDVEFALRRSADGA